MRAIRCLVFSCCLPGLYAINPYPACAVNIYANWEMDNCPACEFNICYGSSPKNYATCPNGWTKETNATLYNLPAGNTYCFAVKSKENSQESGWSNEICKYLPEENVSTNVNASEPVVQDLQWQTETPTTALLEIGTAPEIYDVAFSQPLGTSHVFRPIFSEWKTYFYKVALTSQNGLPVYSASGSRFTTASNNIGVIDPGKAAISDGAYITNLNAAILWAYNSAISSSIYFPYSGTYIFSVSAFGTQAYGQWPVIRILIDRQYTQSITIGDDTENIYRTYVEIQQGNHEVKLVFINDAYDPENNIDRNAFVAGVSIEYAQRLIRHSEMTAIVGAPDRDNKFFIIWANGSIGLSVPILDSELHSAYVLAKGTSAENQWPIMRLLENEILQDETTVDSQSALVYTLFAYLQQGNRFLSLAFQNDFWSPTEDRNLFVGPMALQPCYKLLLASDMTPTAGGPDGDSGWNLWSNGELKSVPITFPKSDLYFFSVFAKGTDSDGNWPRINILLDGKITGQKYVTSPFTKEYIFYANVPAGAHELALRFDNDLYVEPGMPGKDTNLIVSWICIH